jgi:hypothetical protein
MNFPDKIYKLLFLTILIFCIGNFCAAQSYSDLGAWYYGSTFKATEDGYIDGFSIHANAPTPSYVGVYFYGPYTTEAAASSVINGGGSTALWNCPDRIHYQAFNNTQYTYNSNPPPSYTGWIYGFGYSQPDPNTQITVDGLLEKMSVEAGKYYLVFFACSNSTYSGNQYRLTRVVSTKPTGTGYDHERTYFLSNSSPYQHLVSPYLDFSLSITQDNLWTGNTDSDWNTASNWSRGIVPESFAYVSIPNASNMPALTSSGSTYNLDIPAGSSLNIGAGTTLSVYGDIYNKGYILGDLLVNGTAQQIVELGTVENVTIDNMGGVFMTDAASFSGALRLGSGSLFTNGNILNMKATSSQTSLIDHVAGDIVGEVVMNQFVPAGQGHHFLSSPMSASPFVELDDDFDLNLSELIPNLYYYDEPASGLNAVDGWTSPASGAANMRAGTGYTGYFGDAAGQLIDISGEVNNGPVSVSLTALGSGWNFVGNPYPSPIDWDNVVIPAGMNGAYYLWDEGFNRYASYIGGNGTNGGTDEIALMQGFFVQATSSATLSFDNSCRITTTSNAADFYKSNNSPLLRLLFSDTVNSTEAVVLFKAAATSAFDRLLDAQLIETDANSFSLSTISSDALKLAINALPVSDIYSTLSLSNSTIMNAVSSIELTQFDNFDSKDEVFLFDKVLNSTHNLMNAPYSFNTSPSDPESRFDIYIRNSDVAVQQIDSNLKKMKVFLSDGILNIQFNENQIENQILNVYNSLGQIVFSQVLQAGNSIFRIPSDHFFEAGIFIADIQGFSPVFLSY